LHSIPTTTTFNTVQSEVEEFNLGTHLPCPPRWLTTEANVRIKQLLLCSSPLPAKTLQKKASPEASHSLRISSKFNATCPLAQTPNAPNACSLAATPHSTSALNNAIFTPWNTLHTSIPAAD